MIYTLTIETRKTNEGRTKMNREERTFLESITFTYLVGELEWDPIKARRKVETMTDEELEKFLE